LRERHGAQHRPDEFFVVNCYLLLLPPFRTAHKETHVKVSVTFDQLDQMVAEVLPERTVLSVIVTPPGGGGAISGGGEGGAVAMSTCTTTNSYTNPGVIGLLAPQVQSGPIQTTTCVPTAVASGGGGGAAIMAGCTTTNSYTNPGVLGLLAPQVQSGPIQTVTCVPAAVAS
jgi:hypothetical protein